MNKIQVVKIELSGKIKPSWAIKYPSGKMHGQYVDKQGYTRYSAWQHKYEAQSFLDKLIKDAGDFMNEITLDL